MYKKVFTSSEEGQDWNQKFLGFCSELSPVALYDSSGYDLPLPGHNQGESFSYLLAWGVVDQCVAGESGLDALEKFLAQHTEEYVFLGLSYDLKNEVEELPVAKTNWGEFPLVLAFVPEVVIVRKPKCTEVFMHASAKQSWEKIHEQFQLEAFSSTREPLQWQAPINADLDFEQYRIGFDRLKQHIQAGDIYEANFCLRFSSEGMAISPEQLFTQMNAKAKAPFASFFKFDEWAVSSSSPERYLCRRGNQLFSQPIKGTGKRHLEDVEKDEQSAQALFASEKERAENVMIVDLVRNDLSKVCEVGSVRVEELFGIYSFPQVHQMISTVSGILNRDASLVDLLRASFPMGSMTGAPKLRAMELIDAYEPSARGWYSGALGYVLPNGDFDFNVLIRSIFLNTQKQTMSFSVGSAITDMANAQEEYEECLLKAKAMALALGVDEFTGKI